METLKLFKVSSVYLIMDINILSDKAEALYKRYGIKSISMDDISRELGISKKTLYQHVENKSALVKLVFSSHVNREIAKIDSIAREADNAITSLVEMSKYIGEELKMISPTTIYDMQKYYRETFNEVEQFHNKHLYKVIKENIERGIKEGLYRDNINADIIAKIYIGRNFLLIDEDIFPVREYNTELLYIEYIRYHIYGIANKKGLAVLEQYTNQTQ